MDGRPADTWRRFFSGPAGGGHFQPLQQYIALGPVHHSLPTPAVRVWRNDPASRTRQLSTPLTSRCRPHTSAFVARQRESGLHRTALYPRCSKCHCGPGLRRYRRFRYCREIRLGRSRGRLPHIGPAIGARDDIADLHLLLQGRSPIIRQLDWRDVLWIV